MTPPDREAEAMRARLPRHPLPVVVVAQHDLTRRQVLIYTILGQAAVQLAVAALRVLA